ncbi:MAG: LysR substrate-binding domain-containing protein [Saprospiraceae bacterium]|nr:LysR substrate-binding domain-containing protein [Saprospiraceae bacterium]MDW8483551.1 LysR substrate-binding domain-containing protein [Saprospiraceae bacterium]
MNLQQLEYLIALEAHRHFGKAAAECFVTQPTLSAMVQKIEEELGVKLFDRSRQPIALTDAGERLLPQVRVILREVERLREMAREEERDLKGELRIGVIPTLSPYLMPLFLPHFVKKYPAVRLKVTERVTEILIERLHKGLLDAAILATPLEDPLLTEHVLFYEAFVVYSSHPFTKESLLPEDLDVNELWLLEEGHCFRSQILKLCDLREKHHPAVEYQAGSLETLKHLVDAQHGVTILPELVLSTLTPAQMTKVKRFAEPAPVREISLVTHRHAVKERLLKALQEEILFHLPEECRRRQPAQTPLTWR